LIILLPILVATHVIWGYAVSNHIGTHCNGPCRDSLPCTLPMYIVCPDVVPSGGNHIRVQQVYAVKPLYWLCPSG
jgi:hypothetical protein